MEPDRKSQTYALEFIQTHIPAWQNVTENDIKVTKMPSGTNHVLKIKNTQGAEPKCLIYRIFTTSETVDTSQEKRVFTKLAEMGIGPQSYGADQYCRLEYFLQGFTDLTLEQIQQDYMIEHITRLMRSLNQVDMSEVCSKTQNIFMQNLLKWREIAIPMFPLSAEYPENRRSLLPSIEGILSEDTLSTIRDLLPSEYDPVFCHGDFLAGNVLYKAGSNQGLIDFEYAGYSYGAFDIANMINESHIDNSEPEWPYWGFVEKYKADNARIAKWVKAYGEGIDFWVEVKVFICVNNFYWALWGLTMVPSWERGDFLDHMSYAVMRYETGMKDLVEIQELGRQGLREIGEQFFN